MLTPIQCLIFRLNLRRQRYRHTGFAGAAAETILYWIVRISMRFELKSEVISVIPGGFCVIDWVYDIQMCGMRDRVLRGISLCTEFS